MKGMNVYLIFDGNAGEAMRFYKQVFGGNLFEMKFSEAPGEGGSKIPPEAADRMMHAGLRVGNTVLMASDTMPGMPFKQGNNFTIAVDCDNSEEVDKFFGPLSKGGTVSMQPQETFWAHRFAGCTDQFGVAWMFTHSKPMPTP